MIALDPAARARLDRYVALLLERNRSVNLTAARDPEAIEEHIVDALALVPYVRSPHVDVGSGGGFPAIPLAIATGIHVTMIEATAKKASFLTDAVRALAIDADVIVGRAEEVARDPAHRERYASATARAVGALPTVMELTIPFLAIGGVALLQRGAIDEGERIAASDAALVLGADVGPQIATGGERRLLVVTKQSPTGPRFPRRSGIPAKRPLCVGQR